MNKRDLAEYIFSMLPENTSIATYKGEGDFKGIELDIRRSSRRFNGKQFPSGGLYLAVYLVPVPAYVMYKDALVAEERVLPRWSEASVVDKLIKLISNAMTEKELAVRRSDLYLRLQKETNPEDKDAMERHGWTIGVDLSFEGMNSETIEFWNRYLDKRKKAS